MDTVMQQIFEKLKDIIARKLNLDANKKEAIKMESNLVQDLGANDVNMVQIVIEIQSSFDISMPPKVTDKLETVGDYATYIRRHTF